jgi:hypothetical protein
MPAETSQQATSMTAQTSPTATGLRGSFSLPSASRSSCTLSLAASHHERTSRRSLQSFPPTVEPSSGNEFENGEPMWSSRVNPIPFVSLVRFSFFRGLFVCGNL